MSAVRNARQQMLQKALRNVVLGALCCALPWGRAAAQSLHGSPASVERMARYAKRHHLYRYQTRGGVLRAIKRHRLVHLDQTAPYRLHNVTYPYVQPDTRLFVDRLSVEYLAACGDTLVVTSAVRPINAQPWNSTPLSVHPTGMAVDLHKPADPQCRAWLRQTLLSLEAAGVLEATEEFAPPHFHVAVFTTSYHTYVARLTGKPPLQRADTREQRLASTGADSVYAVRRGDTLWDIARHYHTSVDGLMRENRLDGATLQPGQRLVIPQ